MKRKLSLILAMIMILATATTIFASVGVSAAYADSTVAVIGDTEYDDLQLAFDKARDGDTIEIVKDVTQGDMLFVSTEDPDDAETVFFKHVTIKGNNKVLKITGANSDNYAITFSRVNATVEDLVLYSTGGSGISIADSAQVYLKNCKVYAGNTAPGKAFTLGTTEAPHDFKKSIAVRVKNTKRALVTIDGGEYMAYQGTVIHALAGNAVIKGGTFNGLCTEFVLRVNPNKAGDAETANMWIYGGTFVRSAEIADQYISGSVARADRGGHLYIYGGDFVNYTKYSKPVNEKGALLSGKSETAIEKRQGVLLAGESGNKGELWVFGGNFYQLAAESSLNSVGNFGKAETMSERILGYFYGGTFHTVKTTDPQIAECDSNDIQHLAADEYTKVTAMANGTYGGKNYNFLNTTFSYQYSNTNPDADAALKVANPDGTVYYTDTLETAINCLAQAGATVTLLKDITLNFTAEIANRGEKIILDGNGKKITMADTVEKYGISFRTGDITIQNVTVEGKVPLIGVGDSADNGSETLTYIANVTLKNVTANLTGVENAICELPLQAGTLTQDKVTLNGTEVNDIKAIALPKIDNGEDDGGDDNGDDNGNNNGDNNNSGDNSNTVGDTEKDTGKSSETQKNNEVATDKTESKGGCKSSVAAGALLLTAFAVAGGAIAYRKKED